MQSPRFAALALVALLATAAQAKRPIVPDDIARIVEVEDPQIDAAGAWIAYTATTSDVEKDKSESHLWMVSWDGKQQVQLTSRKGESEHTPRFSPDGHWLAFISDRTDEDENDQLWLMNRSGGEAVMLPGLAGSVDDLVWSPDSKRLALVVTDPDPKPATPTTGAAEDKKRPQPIVIDRYFFK